MVSMMTFRTCASQVLPNAAGMLQEDIIAEVVEGGVLECSPQSESGEKTGAYLLCIRGSQGFG